MEALDIQAVITIISEAPNLKNRGANNTRKTYFCGEWFDDSYQIKISEGKKYERKIEEKITEENTERKASKHLLEGTDINSV